MLDFLLGAIKFASLAFLVLMGVAALAALAETIRNRRRVPAPEPQRPRVSITPRHPPARIDLAASRPAPALTELRGKFAGGPKPLSAEASKAVAERVNDLIEALTAAHAALVGDAPGALDLVASRLVYCHWASGSAWRRYLIELNEFEVAEKVSAALADDVRPIAGELARRLAADSALAITRRNGAGALACAVCGGDAVTFIAAEPGMRCSTLSPINAGPECRGDLALRLAALLDAGDARAVVELLTGADGPGCDAYCPECDRVYCKDHYAVETIWSGSWHEATNATCPMSHPREFE